MAAILAPEALANSNDLPNLGNPSEQTLSLAEERKIGRDFYQRMRQSVQFVSDAQINHYIQSLGERLANPNNLGNQELTFFVIDDPNINAFAVPGGYIGFFSGLIDVAQNESQLASVVAHEIAHITQRHIARLYAKQRGISLAASAAVIAGLIASAQGNVQVGTASVLSGLAATQQSQINYTRAHEEEADRIGIEMLEKSGFDTSGMAQMFDIIQRASLRSESERFEFLRTHPLSIQRISEARARASRHSQNNVVSVDSFDFGLMKARLKVLGSDNLHQLKQTLLDANKEQATASNRYALALSYQKLAQASAAQPYIDALLAQEPESVWLLLLQADNLTARGKIQQATDLLFDLHQTYPNNYPILASYLDTLDRQGRHKEAARTAKAYIFESSKPQLEAYKQLAYHQNKLHEDASSHINLANYFLALEDLGSAHNQLKLALNTPNISTEEARRASAKLDEIKAIRQY